jgi:hypothetical protein
MVTCKLLENALAKDLKLVQDMKEHHISSKEIAIPLRKLEGYGEFYLLQKMEQLGITNIDDRLSVIKERTKSWRHYISSPEFIFDYGFAHFKYTYERGEKIFITGDFNQTDKMLQTLMMMGSLLRKYINYNKRPTFAIVPIQIKLILRNN